MLEWIRLLFDTTGFPARWHCGTWSATHGWVHITSDLIIFGAYFTIPVMIGSIMLRRKKVPFPKVFALFACFIFACGSVHLIEATIFWHPMYRFAGLLKVITAIVSVTTVIVIIPQFPALLSMRTREELEVEVKQRREAEEKLRLAYQNLELLVDERTKELKRSNKDLEEFAYAVSHDLKAPLRAIINLSTWLEEELGPNVTPQASEYISLLQDRTHRMRSMLQGLLDYSKVGRGNNKVEEVDVKELCEETVDLLGPSPDMKVEYIGDFPVLKTWQAPLQQVFINLISNAFKYGEDGKKIEIQCQEEPDYYTFSVRDFGTGIAPEHHTKIFEMYQTLEARDTGESTGMGLALFKRVVEEAGGIMGVESELGKGSLFYFTWPKTLPAKS